MTNKPLKHAAARRPRRRTKARPTSPNYEAVADVTGSIVGPPPDLSARKKHYLKATGYGLTRQQRRLLELTGKLAWDPAFDYKAERQRD
jgi:hypothetical protein